MNIRVVTPAQNPSLVLRASQSIALHTALTALMANDALMTLLFGSSKEGLARK